MDPDRGTNRRASTDHDGGPAGAGRDPAGTLTRREASAAVDGWGWRYLLGAARTAVPVATLAQAVDVAARAAAACGDDADGHLWIDVRPDRVSLTVQSRATASVTARDVDLVGRISAAVRGLGLATGPDVGGPGPRSLQAVEIAIDALDIAAVRPFWQAVTGYADEAQADDSGGLVDPLGQGPAIWFQRMDAPRPQRNRIHLDICVPHDGADHRIRAALHAGGTLVSDAHAPAFWVLADAEGNEVCITTWQGRDD
jgi:4a-hydroxytetrahydrobiopterin dehydratase